MKLLVFKTAKKLGVSIPRIFGLAFEYAEDFRDFKELKKYYYDWLHRDIIHPVVIDFCLDMLAERAQLL
jgi:hypothetical protein